MIRNCENKVARVGVFGTEGSFLELWVPFLELRFFLKLVVSFLELGVHFLELRVPFLELRDSFFGTRGFLLCRSLWISCEYYEDYEDYHAVVLPSLGPGATGKPIHLLPTLTKTIIRNFSWNIVSNIISEILPSFMNCKVVYNTNFFHITIMNCERIDSDFWRHTQLHPMWLVCDYVLKIMHRYCINGGQVALL